MKPLAALESVSLHVAAPMKIRLYADFNNMTEDDKVLLSAVGSRKDIDKHKESLAEGLVVILSDNELEVEARLIRDDEHAIWLGIPDWSTRRDLT